MQLVVGKIAGPHGLKGFVKIIVRTDDPALRFQEGVILDTDSEELPELTIEAVRNVGDSWQLKFEEVDDRTAAENLQGTELTIDTDEWDSDEDEWYDADLIGLPAHTIRGEYLGEIVAVEHGPAQDLLVLKMPGGKRALVPFVTAIVPDVTENGVTIDPPHGLFEMED